MKFDKIKSRMTDLGFKLQEHKTGTFFVGLFYKSVQTKRPCTANGKAQLVVEVFDHASIPGGNAVSEEDRYKFEVNITGEFPVDIAFPSKAISAWAKLKAYSFSPSDFFENYDILEQALVRAWEALA